MPLKMDYPIFIQLRSRRDLDENFWCYSHQKVTKATRKSEDLISPSAWSSTDWNLKIKIKIKHKSHHKVKENILDKISTWLSNLMKVLSYFCLYICSYHSSYLEFSSYSSCITLNKVHITSFWKVLPRITSKCLSSLSLHCCP